MSWSHAFFVVLAVVGAISAAYLVEDFYYFHRHHRRIARRRWPKEQHRSYFTDCKRFPEDDWS